MLVSLLVSDSYRMPGISYLFYVDISLLSLTSVYQLFNLASEDLRSTGIDSFPVSFYLEVKGSTNSLSFSAVQGRKSESGRTGGSAAG